MILGCLLINVGHKLIVLEKVRESHYRTKSRALWLVNGKMNLGVMLVHFMDFCFVVARREQH